MEIKVNNISYTSNKKYILKNIDTCFKDNTINFITGSNKNILLKLLSGDLLPSKGSILVDNIKIDYNTSQNILDELKKTVGFITYINDESITVKEAILANLNKYNYNNEKKEKHLRDALKMVNLGDIYLDSKLSNLSTGEQKRVFIAATLAYNPKIILIDDNILALDINGKNNLIKIIRLLKNRFHKTIIIASNDSNVIHKLSDFIYVLNKDTLTMVATKYEIFTDEQFLRKNHIEVPKVINFSNLVLKNKKVKLGYRDEINDLLKDIYRYAKKW